MYQSPLFETLAVIDGQFQQIELHQQRVNRSFQHYFKCNPILQLSSICIPAHYKNGFFRCRIDYNATNYKVEYFPYTPKQITTFQCIETANLDYQFKYSDRKRLDNLNKLQSDEIIIINNGFVSDCTIGNLLFLKNEKWYSPQHYLLKGTQLTYLLAQQRVALIPIQKTDLAHFEKIMMINALNPFDLKRAIAITPQTLFY